MRRSLRSWLWQVPLTREVDEELAFHLAMRTRELIEQGMEPAAARQAALARLGDLAALRRTCLDEGRKRDRTMRIRQWLEELKDDVKFGVRQLRAAPGFAIVATVTLALGIGANSAIFALADATLLRPLPVPHPERLVMAWESSDQDRHGGVSPLNMADWRDRSRAVEGMAGFIPYVGSMVMAGADGTAMTVPRQWVTAGVFRVLGITPVAGRTFLPGDERQPANVCVISEAFWRERFGGDRSIVGRAVALDGTPYTIVGVVPMEAQLIGESSIWALRSFPQRPACAAPTS